MYLRGRFFQLRKFRKVYDLVPVAGGEGELGPKEIVGILDNYVIGQPGAKKEVSVAIRERWRRLQLPDEKAVEITPKNILVSGPSGCGKTEIIRRVSKLLHAPFVKVDASTFTRRGVVGANVTDMVVDLYDSAEDQCKEFYSKSVKNIARSAAEDLIHHCLYKDLKDQIAKSKEESEPATPQQPQQQQQQTETIFHKLPPAGTSSSGPISLGGLERAIGDLLKKQNGNKSDSSAIHEVVVYNKYDGSSQETDNAKPDVKGNNFAELLEMSYTELGSLDDAVLQDMVRKLMVTLEGKTGPKTPRFHLPILKGNIHIEPTDASEEQVTISLAKSQEKSSLPQILLSSGMGILGDVGGNPSEGAATDSGSVKDLLKWWEGRVLDALGSYRFSSGRSPVKELVEKWGIVCIDEIDKVVGKKGSSGGQDGWMNTDVQQELLTLIEGTKVNIESARSLKSGGGLSVLKMGGQQERLVIDTTHILFVCAGAFTLCKPKDMLVELLGRLPVRVTINSLTEEDLYQILTNTKYPMIQQQSDLFTTEGVTLCWDDDAVREIAKIAWNLNNETENTGARILNSILRAVLSDFSYHASDRKGESITVTKDHVRESTKKLFPPEKLETYVL
eukprot:TRINITY_DN9915_c0_g7_i1.p1 TRINITY_DN9915_c0_g7~~TRINITY_DN9915_c0_g7_i1.p1  ORF type:complete len:618 (+),score=122.83 TRINITY_DN9915_c0_g7_i1:77-1930(+)